MVKAGTVFGLGILAIAVIAFFGLGGLDRSRAFAESLKTKLNPQDNVTVPTSQSGAGNIEIKQGSVGAVDNIISAKIMTQSVAEKRGVASTGIVPKAQASEEVLRKLRSPAGTGVAQFSDGTVGSLSTAQQKEIRARTLTKQEQLDIQALEARRQAAIDRGVNPNVKLSGEELVLRKREQEALSKNLLTERFGGQTFVNGKLFAKAGFESGGLTPALQAERAANAAIPTGRQESAQTVRDRNLTRAQEALEFNRRVIEAKKTGAPIPSFQGFSV